MAIGSYRATFTGTEAYVDVALPTTLIAPAVAMQGLTANDTVGVVEYSITLTSGNARVEPSDVFTGFVDFVVVST